MTASIVHTVARNCLTVAQMIESAGISQCDTPNWAALRAIPL